MFQFIKTTVLGGVLFLIPVIILGFIFRQAHVLIGKLGGPLLASVPVERAVGVALLDLLAIALMVLICFLAGLAAKTQLAFRFVASLESEILSNMPGYELRKAKLNASLRFEEDESPSVLVRFEEQWQVGFEIERIAGGKVVVYLPGAPDPWSGTITIVTDDRITHLESKQLATLDTFKRFGEGASAQLQAYMEKG